jgi:hypothetical protein
MGRFWAATPGIFYIGTYEVKDKILTARVRVSNFLPEIPNVLGIKGDFELDLKVPVSVPVMQGGMSLVGQPGAGIAVKMTKAADL